MVSANMRRILVGIAAVAANLGWLQLAPAFGFPVTAPAGMLDRMLGATREAGPAGWVLLLLGQAAFAALFLLLVEPRRRGPYRRAPGGAGFHQRARAPPASGGRARSTRTTHRRLRRRRFWDGEDGDRRTECRRRSGRHGLPREPPAPRPRKSRGG